MRRESELLRLIIDSVPVGVQVMDKDGNIILSNPAGQRIWGEMIAPAQERYERVKGRWYLTGEPLAPGDWASVRARLQGQASRGEMISIQAFDGQVRTILNSALPLWGEDGSVVGAIVINEDVTEKLEAEQRFLQSQKLETVARVVASAAHDFNNTLTVIQGCGQFLLEALGPHRELRELAEDIVDAASKAAGLTRQMLSIARPTDLHPRVVDLNVILAESHSLVVRVVGPPVEVVLELDSQPCPALVDRHQLEQVLLNLCVNARDAMPDGGGLFLRTRREEVGPCSVLEVADTGVGMEPAVLDRIFEPFFTTKPKDKGTGLGLSAVQRVVEQSGGRVEVETSVGSGTRFTLHLPCPSAEGATFKESPTATTRAERA